ncbi:hypothetical protein HFU84_13215 [Acidithiobacillus sp. CV18-2]|uniref:Uncharacterized protein n=1 Tax=Igneacidithiobacillus copahuensis TaxID=2724909 RepID=A0AAE2YPQ1_9PROT|nr:hypothetical protein [Igneacidithiobacillus copahuensis]MBU2755124.1 hypothetical protein [Acidithiobacillus sp. CV18-3]MBU2756068.1 hypothetical protein [Acidithiobacillus sp. BN09-2]MBU2778434.1 hypothetical protein [Acidithiobacillus sp. CV18-2]MBU2796134.1 hypothetical protein [Acidithiobacillus sp. VAN18-2]MBU2800370.1 hypothetical protein [Acidithiobacillus sp. VAN18-4]
MEVIITNRKVVKHSLMALIILAALTQMAMADITVTAPEDTADPLFTQPVPQTWHFGPDEKKSSSSPAAPAQEQNSVTVTVKTLPPSKAQ